jgi:hypothetical protein
MMKRFFSVAVMVTALAVAFTGCKKDEDDAPQKNIAKLGAQANTSFGGFLSIDMKRVYNQLEASQNQDKIDILCFYEEAGGNNIAVAAPGSGISGIFIGETAPENWTTKNQTYFTDPASDITVAQFDQLKDGDAAIQSYYDETVTSGNRKKKDMKVNDIYAFKTAGGKYGIFKVISVAQGETGYVEFEYKIK